MEQRYNAKSQEELELLIQGISNKIEALKTQYNMFFAGEIRVPPEPDREALEKQVRNLVTVGNKSPRISLLTQNISSKFTLYNNMWLKKLNELEGGFVPSRRKLPSVVEEEKKPKKPKTKPVNVSLNSEDSFDQFYDQYKKISETQSTKIVDKEKMINSIKTKLITSNLIDVKIDFKVEKGAVKIKIKKQFD